jgi:hypothetical protein
VFIVDRYRHIIFTRSSNHRRHGQFIISDLATGLYTIAIFSGTTFASGKTGQVEKRILMLFLSKKVMHRHDKNKHASANFSWIEENLMIRDNTTNLVEAHYQL